MHNKDIIKVGGNSLFATSRSWVSSGKEGLSGECFDDPAVSAWIVVNKDIIAGGREELITLVIFLGFEAPVGITVFASEGITFSVLRCDAGFC